MIDQTITDQKTLDKRIKEIEILLDKVEKEKNQQEKIKLE